MSNHTSKHTVLLIFGVTLIAVMGVASISPALPSIQEHFHLEKGQIKWLISLFSLPGFFLSFFMGILADRFGRKTILVPSLLLFSVAGFLCSFATEYKILLILRFIQGMGAASLSSLNITLIGDFFPGNERARIMGYNASVLSIGTGLYPFIGGSLASIHWQYVFYLPILALPLAIVVLFFLKPPRLKTPGPFFQYFNTLWKTINQSKVWGLFLTNLLVFVILYGAYLTFFPLLLKQRITAHPLFIGIIMSAMSLNTAISAFFLGSLKTRFGAPSLLYFSALVYGISLLIMGFSNNLLSIIVSVVLFGIAHGLYLPNIQTLLVGMSSEKERAGFMSLNSMILRLGQFLGPIVISLFYVRENLRFVFLGAAGVAIIMIIVQKLMVNLEPEIK
ncbi:MAG: MFS transporter [Bacteroidales bacterium]|nr:MFS transporter [Bacteroidales bacterium]